MPAHIYFDLDGTLTDPFEGITKCFVYALEQLGFPRPSEEFLLSCIGPPLYDTFPKIVGEELTLEAVDLYRERFDEIGWLENIPYDGVHDMLESFADSGNVLYIATSKPRIAATRIVKHFELAPYFERVFGCELDGTRANKAELLAHAMTENPATTQRLMIGDRKHDLVGALANGICPIGVSYGYGSVEELNGAGAMAIAPSPDEIPTVIAPYLSPQEST